MERQASEGAHVFGVTSDATLDGVGGGAFFVARLASGEDNGGGHTLEVPFEGAAKCFIEVIDIEDEPTVRSSEGAKIAHVGIAANLHFDAGVGNDGKIGGHDGSRSAKKDEG